MSSINSTNTSRSNGMGTGSGSATSTIIQDFLDQTIVELKKEESQKKIKQILNPVVNYILDQIKPYIFFLFSIFILIIVMIACVIVLTIRNKTK